jgi:hypothetical protein
VRGSPGAGFGCSSICKSGSCGMECVCRQWDCKPGSGPVAAAGPPAGLPLSTLWRAALLGWHAAPNEGRDVLSWRHGGAGCAWCCCHCDGAAAPPDGGCAIGGCAMRSGSCCSWPLTATAAPAGCSCRVGGCQPVGKSPKHPLSCAARKHQRSGSWLGCPIADLWQHRHVHIMHRVQGHESSTQYHRSSRVTSWMTPPCCSTAAKPKSLPWTPEGCIIAPLLLLTPVCSEGAAAE